MDKEKLPIPQENWQPIKINIGKPKQEIPEHFNSSSNYYTSRLTREEFKSLFPKYKYFGNKMYVATFIALGLGTYFYFRHRTVSDENECIFLKHQCSQRLNFNENEFLMRQSQCIHNKSSEACEEVRKYFNQTNGKIMMFNSCMDINPKCQYFKYKLSK